LREVGKQPHEARRTVRTDGERHERDPEAWNAYLAEGNRK
jgi:hypothetical protein